MGTILIVDDDFDIRDSVSDILTDEGFVVATANDGLDALQYLREQPAPCLILLDWMMPRCDGSQFLTQQAADEKIASIPVVILTADARVQAKMPKMEARDFLGKPVKLKRLLEVVKRYCGVQ